jgi:hypothetical protein
VGWITSAVGIFFVFEREYENGDVSELSESEESNRLRVFGADDGCDVATLSAFSFDGRSGNCISEDRDERAERSDGVSEVCGETAAVDCSTAASAMTVEPELKMSLTERLRVVSPVGVDGRYFGSSKEKTNETVAANKKESRIRILIQQRVLNKREKPFAKPRVLCENLLSASKKKCKRVQCSARDTTQERDRRDNEQLLTKS